MNRWIIRFQLFLGTIVMLSGARDGYAQSRLTVFTVRYQAPSADGLPIPVRAMSVESTGRITLGEPVGPRTEGPGAVVVLPTSEVSQLARLLVAPAFTQLAATPPSTNGPTIEIAVHAGSMAQYFFFVGTIPAGAQPVIAELQRIRAVAFARITPGSCSADADCDRVECECRCIQFSRANPPPACSPGHCAAQACTAVNSVYCDAPTHHCALRVPVVAHQEACPSGIPEMVSPLCAVGSVCGTIPQGFIFRGVCVRPGSNNARCDATTPCDSGLTCLPNRQGPLSYCRSPGGTGSPCGSPGDVACVAGLHCENFSSIRASICSR